MAYKITTQINKFNKTNTNDAWSIISKNGDYYFCSNSIYHDTPAMYKMPTGRTDFANKLYLLTHGYDY